MASKIYFQNNFKAELKACETKGEYFVEGYITTDDIDVQNEVVSDNAMNQIEESINTKNIKLDLEHSLFLGEEPEVPLGKLIKAKKVMHEGKQKVWAKGKLNPAHPRFKEAWDSIQDKFVDGFSIAYNTIKESTKQIGTNMVNSLDSIDLLNVALTGNAVNKSSNMTRSYMKSNKIISDGGKIFMEKPHLKSYTKDGAHAHTEDSPIGEHNHPEIEKEISNLWTDFYNLRSKISKPEPDTVTMLSNQGKDAKLKSKGGKIMAEEPVKPVETPALADATPAPVAPIEPVKPEPVEETKDAEIKSLKSEMAQMKSMQAETNKVIAQLKATLEKPNLKGLQEPKEVEHTPMEDISPLSMIR